MLSTILVNSFNIFLTMLVMRQLCCHNSKFGENFILLCIVSDFMNHIDLRYMYVYIYNETWC